MMQPGMLDHLRIAPGGPLSQLAPFALSDPGPEAGFVIGGLSPDDSPEVDIEVTPPAVLDPDR
jgi:hypothetical protein